MTAIQVQTILASPIEGITSLAKEVHSVLPLSLGEVLDVVVDAQTGTSRFELVIKNEMVSVYSDLPLARGDRLTVKVEQIQPQVLLSIVQDEDRTSAIMNRYALYSRANPEGLKNIFLSGRDVLTQALFSDSISEKEKQVIDKIINLFDLLTLSATSGKEQFSIKNYLVNLGMLLEFDLRQAVEGRKNVGDIKKDSLKGLLQRLVAGLKTWQVRESNQDNIQQILKLIEFSEKAVKTIEGHQILNTRSLSADGNGFFQIPVFLYNDLRIADLFIHTEQDKAEGAEVKKYNIAIFLNLDALGEIMVEASMAGSRLRCLLKFADPEVKEFVSGFMDDLEREIRGIGFGEVLLNCMQSDSIEKARIDHYQNIYFDREAVNVFA